MESWSLVPLWDWWKCLLSGVRSWAGIVLGVYSVSWILTTSLLKVRVLSLCELALNYQQDTSLPLQWNSPHKWSPSHWELLWPCFFSVCSRKQNTQNIFFECNCISSSRKGLFLHVPGSASCRHAWPSHLLRLALVKELCRYFLAPKFPNFSQIIQPARRRRICKVSVRKG